MGSRVKQGPGGMFMPGINEHGKSEVDEAMDNVWVADREIEAQGQRVCLDPWHWGSGTDVLRQTLQFKGRKYGNASLGDLNTRQRCIHKTEAAQPPGRWISNSGVE